MFNSRNKGARAELEVAELLRNWWRSSEPDVIFKRTPSSGGWASRDARGAFNTAGDLVTTSTTFPWVVEIKYRENWVWKTVMQGRPSPVWGWWKQAQTQAEEMRAEPMLWFRKNRESWHVLLSDKYARMMEVDAFFYWVPEALCGVDYGSVFPCLLRETDLLRVDPHKFAKVLF